MICKSPMLTLTWIVVIAAKLCRRRSAHRRLETCFGGFCLGSPESALDYASRQGRARSNFR